MKKISIPALFLFVLMFFTLLFTGCATGLSRREAARLYYNLGNAYLELGENVKASEAYLKALEYDKKMKIASYNLVKAYIAVEKYTDALLLLDEMLSSDPDNILLLTAKAYSLYRFGLSSQAAAYYAKIISMDSSNTEALYNYSVVQVEKEDYEAALENLVMLRRLDVKDENLKNNINFMLGKIYYNMEQYEMSLQYLESVYSKDKKNMANLLMLFSVYNITGYYSDVLNIGQEILEQDPANSTIMFEISYVLLAAVEDPVRGIDYLEKAIAAGFEESDKIKLLISNPDLIEIEQIKKILENAELLDD